MIDSLYKQYFQKSRSFLYPALGIGKAPYVPIQTFISLDEPPITPADRKLVCLFERPIDARFEIFEEELSKNPLFSEFVVTPANDVIYIFDYHKYSDDWDKFLQGSYSQLSMGFKTAIRDYYGRTSKEYSYIDSYLFPEKYFTHYAKLLDIDVSILLQVGELCDKPNLEKEKLIFSTINLETSI